MQSFVSGEEEGGLRLIIFMDGCRVLHYVTIAAIGDPLFMQYGAMVYSTVYSYMLD